MGDTGARTTLKGAVAISFVFLGCARESQVGAPPDVKQESPPLAVAPPRGQTGFATYYARKFTGRRTANGERYDPTRMTAAHRTLPFGTMVEVRRQDGRSVIVRINDRGPYVDGRIIDLSRKAAEMLGLVHDGRTEVELIPLPSPPPGD